MRIKAILNVKKLSSFFQHRFIAFGKEVLLTSDNNYKINLYNKNIPKPFTFSLNIPHNKVIKKEKIQIDPNFIIEDNVMYFPDELVNLYISTSDYEFMVHFYNGLRNLKKFSFSSDDNMLINSEKIEIQIKDIIMLPEKNISKKNVLFRTNSPILIENKNDKPILFNDLIEFNIELNKIQDTIFKTLRGYGLKQPLVFTPQKMRKKVVKHTLKEFREKTGKPLMYLTTNSGIFELQGHPEDLKLMYQIGIGNRTSQGFGMIDIIG